MGDRLLTIKKIVLVTVLFFVTLMTAILLSTRQPSSIHEIYVFGDSLSDTGAVLQATSRTYPPNPPYFQGRYSNGRVWVEYLAQRLSTNRLHNFAYGGATTASDRTSLVPGLLSQVQSFTQTHRHAGAEALYVLWAGANDYLQGATNPAIPVSNIVNAIAALTQVGAEKILVANLPNLGQLPVTRSSANSGQLSALTEAHNLGLWRSLKQLKQQYPGLQIVTLDAYSLYQQAITQPSTFGLTNVTQSCLLGVQSCRYPDRFLFWDNIHPTTVGHKVLADDAFSELQEGLITSAHS